ncbi:hypothetical protein L7F22_011440 [Adiantum nelumboides]|nr:hypothetical protein [Adiantum nelumboides]
MDVDVREEPAEVGEGEAEQGGREATDKAAKEAVPKNAVEKAASIALGAAAAKAHILATFEEQECQKLVGQVIEAQMRKMEIKMAQFEQLESLLEQERRSLEVARKQLYSDRLNVAKQIQMVQELVKKAQSNPTSLGRGTWTKPRRLSMPSSAGRRRSRGAHRHDHQQRLLRWRQRAAAVTVSSCILPAAQEMSH